MVALQLFGSMDSDDSGLVEFAEFVKVMSNKEGEAGDAVKHSLVRFKNGGENVVLEPRITFYVLSFRNCRGTRSSKGPD